MSDNKLDNDFDLLKATITHVNENKVPKVTLKINIVDILAAQEAYEDWDKLKAGDLINIYFDDFNIDLVAQIKEISIDFEQHTLDVTISTVHNYNTGYGKYVSRTLRRLYNADTNITKHLEDANRISSEESRETYQQLTDGTIKADNAQITFGATDSTGAQSTSFSGTGGSSLVIEAVDPVVETITFSANKGVGISDGTITTYYDRGAGNIKTEVEISGANGFVIRNTDNDTGVVTRVAYIDETTGAALFAGWKLDPGQFSSGDDSSFVGINSEDPAVSGTINKTYAFWAGDETASAAPFSVTKAGDIKATSGTISGLTIGTGTYVDPGTSTSYDKNAIYAGDGIYGDNDTPFYLDEDGRFSLSDELKWDPDYNGGTFFVNGTIEATVGQIGGWKVDENTLTSVDNSNVLTPNIQLDRSGRILIAGSTFGGADNEYITDARIIIDNTGITGNDGTNTTFRLTTDGVLTNAAIRLDSEDYSIRIGDLISDGIQSIAGNYGLIVQNDTAEAAVPYQVIVSEEGFFITTIDGVNMADKALAVQYDYDRIWAKRLVISDLLPEDSSNQTEEQALLEASTLIGRLSPTEHGVRVIESYDDGGVDKFNIIKMSTEGFAIYQNKSTITSPTNPTFEVLTDGSISATSLKISGTSELGGWTVADTYFESNNYEYTSGNFSDEGIKFNENGTIIAKEFAIDSLGNAYFSGALQAASGSFSGEITAESGEIGGFTIGETTLTAGGTGEAIGISPSTGTNISFYAGAAVTSPALLPTTAEIDDSPFRVTKTGVLNATGATISGTINANAGNFTSTVTIGSLSPAVDGILQVGANADANNRIYIKGTTVASSSSIYSGTTDFESGTGFYMNAEGKFFVGNSSAQYMSWDNTTGLLSVVGDIGGNIGQIAVGNRVRITQDGLFGLESNGAAINTSSNNFRLSALDGGIYAKFGQIASWNIDADSIYVGTKTASGNFSSAGHVTLGSDGHISANQFRIDTNGNAFFKGDLTAASGTFGSTSSGHVILGNSTNPLQVKNSTTSLMNLSSGGVLTVAGFTAASSALYTGTKSSFASNNAGVYVAPDGIALGTNSPFKVTSSGVLTANSGLIAGFTIDTRDFIGSYTPTVVTSTSTVTIGTGSKTFSFSTTTTTNWRVGDYIYARGSSNARRMWGNITSLSTTSVTINVLTTLGTGVTQSSWTLGFLYNYTASITPANMQIKGAGLSGFFTSSNPFINLGLVNSDPNPDPQQLVQYSGPSLDISESGDTIVRGNTTQVGHTARFKANALEFWGGSALDNEIMIHNWGQGMLTMASYGPLALRAGFNVGTGGTARIYVSRPDYALTVLRNPNGTGGFDGATEVSSKIVKENFKEINQEDLKTFLDKVEMKKFNYKENKYQIGYSFVLEDEIEKNTPFINEITYSINGTTIFEEKELPDYLRPYLGTGYLKQREDGKYEYSSLEYRSSALAGITLAATQLNHNRIKELEEENKKLKDEIALIKEKLGM